MICVCHCQQRLEPPQYPVTAPILTKLHHRFGQVPRVAFELLLKLLKQCKRVRCRSSKPSQHLAITDQTHLFRVRFHDRLANGDLSIATHSYRSGLANAQYRGGPKRVVLHVFLLPLMPPILNAAGHALGCARSYTFFKRSTLV